MRWTSIVAIFTLFWVLSAFLVMPFGVRTHDELGMNKVAGQAHSAPGNFRPRPFLLRTTVLAIMLFGLYYVNYVHQWITVDTLDISPWLGEPKTN
jgi:predicted secreted protein